MMIANGTFEELNNAAQQGSLEQLFTQLTGNNEHTSVAEQFIQTISNK
jgi:ABC-2 type transport system ATP-binding protein